MASIGNIPWNKGKKNPYSKDTIEKMKNARLGKSAFWNLDKKRTEENKSKISKTLTGRKLPKEVCENMSRARKGVPNLKLRGRKIPEETLIKLRQRKGDKNPAWQGGITAINICIRTSKKNTDFIQKILKLDNYTCQNCFKIGVKLEVHHIKYFSKILKDNNIKTIEDALACKELWDINNCITLCVSCHKKQQKEKITWIPVGHRCNQNNYYG